MSPAQATVSTSPAYAKRFIHCIITQSNFSVEKSYRTKFCPTILITWNKLEFPLNDLPESLDFRQNNVGNVLWILWSASLKYTVTVGASRDEYGTRLLQWAKLRRSQPLVLAIVVICDSQQCGVAERNVKELHRIVGIDLIHGAHTYTHRAPRRTFGTNT